MKIRIKDSSIRLRLSKKDVNILSEEGCVLSECQITVGNTLKYMISLSDKEEISIKMKYNTIDLKVPHDQLEAFLREDKVGFEHIIVNGVEGGLHILVEKDFQCLVPRVQEDETNLYTNPQAK